MEVAGRQSAKHKRGNPVLVPSPSDSTVACPLLTVGILASKAVLSTGKRKKAAIFTSTQALVPYMGELDQ